MSQPAVTFQIKQLEEQFQTNLFERLPGRVNLTPAGEIVLEYAEKIMALSDEMESRIAEMTGEMRGVLLIGASTSIAENILPRVLSEFNALYPQVRPRLIVGNSELIETRVVAHALDIGLIGGKVLNPEIEHKVCADDVLSAFCSPDYPLAGVKQVSPKSLSEYEYVAREPGSGSRAVAEEWFRNGGVAIENLKTLMEVGSPEALKNVVRGGIGFAIAPPRIVAEDVAAGRLVSIPLKPPLKRPLTLLYPKNRFRSRMVQTFSDFVSQQLKEFES